MGFFSEYLRRLWYLINRRRLERELQREMETHREMMGEPRRFGNVLRLREESRDVWGWNRVDDVCRDLKFAFRSLSHSPGFTAGALLVLTSVIGLNLVLFQIYNLLVLKPLQVRDAQSIVEFVRESGLGRKAPIPYPAAEYIRSHNNVLPAVLTTSRQRYVFWNGDFEKRWPAQLVSANWFEELGIGAAAGRVFRESVDGEVNAAPAVILTHYFWVSQLNSDPNTIGTTIRINDRPATIVGILPENQYSGLEFISESPMFLPMEQVDYFFPGTTLKTDWKGYVDTYARVKPGMSLVAVRESLRTVVAELALQRPADFNKGEWLEPLPSSTHFEDPDDRPQRLFTAIGFGFLALLVLAVACANLSNFILSRGIGRLRELNIRMALGASRWRVMRLLIAESVLLAGTGAAAGVILASVVLHQTGPFLIGMPFAVGVDWRTILSALCIAAAAVFAVGLLPTWTISRRDLGSGIKDGGYSVTASLTRTRLRSILTAVQVGGSFVLLLLAALTARNLYHALSPGVDFKKVAVLNVPVLFDKNIDASSYWSGLRRSVASLAETEDLAIVQYAPLGTVMTVWQEPDAPGLSINANKIEPQFFDLMRVPLITGRTFDASDTPDSSVILSKRLAIAVYGTVDVLGKRFPRTSRSTDNRIRTIVGIVDDAHSAQFDAPNAAELYLPMDAAQLRRSAVMIVRARTDPRLLLAPMRDASRAIDSRLLVEAHLMSRDFETKLRDRAVMSSVVAALGSMTLLLACIGVFGVISYSSSLRRKEISIRLALGANRRSLLVLLMKQSLGPAAVGGAGGLIIGLASSQILQSHRVYVGSLDAPVLISVAAVVAITCVCAALHPASRALRADIAQTLRDE
jgi:predicted permease